MDGEACFAASGSNIAAASAMEAVFVSGGTISRIFRKDTTTRLPLLQGKESTGANSIASYRINPRKKASNFIVVGGDFSNYKIDSATCAISRDGGKSWHLPKRPPYGYKSCVMWASQNRLVACGTSGVDVSEDGGMNWKRISDKGFHVCVKSKKGKTYYLAGPKGNISRLDW